MWAMQKACPQNLEVLTQGCDKNIGFDAEVHSELLRSEQWAKVLLRACCNQEA
jgi:hypothetical protein